MEVKISCQGAMTYSLNDLVASQDALKTLSEEKYQALRKEILEEDFNEPVSVWLDPSGSKRIINGHQRVHTLKRMKTEGVVVPNEIPCSLVIAKDEKSAMRKVLGLAGQYGAISGDGLLDFINKWDISFENIKDNLSLPDLDMDWFNEQFLREEILLTKDVPTQVIDANLYNNQAVKQIILIFDSKEYDEVVKMLDANKAKHSVSTNTDLVLKYLREDYG